MTIESFSNDPYDVALLVTGGLLLLVGGSLLLSRLWRRDRPFPYTQKPLGTDLQRSWLPQLREAVRDDYDILPSVRLDDLLDVDRSARARIAQRAAEKLAGRVVDFVLLAPGTLDPLAVVLLEDDERQQGFCSAALLAGGLAVVTLPARPLPAIDELRELLRREMGIGASTAPDEPVDDWVLGTLVESGAASEEWSLGGDALDRQPSEPRPGADAAASWPPCPDCGSPRVPRRVNRGRHAGRYFLVCERYPSCQSLQPLKLRHP
jgi:hypothetical protein